MLKNEIKEIAEALNGDYQTFCLRWVDLYETVYDISDEEYQSYLDTRSNEIKE